MNVAELFRGKGPVDENIYPHLKGGLRSPFGALVKARRNASELTTSRILIKGLIWLLSGRVRAAYFADDKLYVEIQGSSDSYVTCALYRNEADVRIAFVPHGSVNYYLAVLLIAEAIRAEDSGDFMGHLDALVKEARTSRLSGSEGERREMVVTADELYYYAAYGSADPIPDTNRLDSLAILPLDTLKDATGARTYVNLGPYMPPALRAPGTTVSVPPDMPTPVALPKPSAAPSPISAPTLPSVLNAFHGPQARQMYESLRMGDRVLALGKPGTGKTTAVSLVAEALDADIIPIQGHRGLYGSSLIGSIKPVIKPNQSYQALLMALQATVESFKEYPGTKGIGHGLEAALTALSATFPSLPLSDRELVPGPLVRALRSGRDKTRRAALIFFDEFTRVPQEEREPLLHLCNEHSKEEMARMGVDTRDWPGPFYALTVEETGEIEWAPKERVFLVCGGNNSLDDAVEPIEEAQSRRFGSTLYFRYPSVSEEVALVLEKVTQECVSSVPPYSVPLSLSRKRAQALVEFADHTRKQTTVGALNPASLIAWAIKVARKAHGSGGVISAEQAWELGLQTWSRLVVREDADGYPNVTNEGALKVRFTDLWKRAA